MYVESLKQLGLSQKEAMVYIAALELGFATAQELTYKTGLRRPTVYFTIELLKKRGLMSSFEKGKKTYFAAESPENLQAFVGAQEKLAEVARQTFSAILGELAPLFDKTGERPRVRFFEGKEGLKTMQEDFLRTQDKSIVEFFSHDDLRDVFTPEERMAYRERKIKKKIISRAIYTRKDGPLLEGIPYAEFRWVPQDRFSFSSDIIVYGSKVAIASLRGRLVGVIIESREMADTIRAVFELAWEGAK